MLDLSTLTHLISHRGFCTAATCFLLSFFPLILLARCLSVISSKAIVTPQNNIQIWLDCESKYRLTLENIKEAKEGASYAEEFKLYEKRDVANKQAKRDLECTLSAHAEERAAMEAEKGLIKEIMAFVEAALNGDLGGLHDTVIFVFGPTPLGYQLGNSASGLSASAVFGGYLTWRFGSGIDRYRIRKITREQIPSPV